MRFDGELKTWNDDKGFGFISPRLGGQDVFIHISELKSSGRPQVGDELTFEVELNPQGKKRAVRVQYAGPGKLEHHRHGRGPLRISRNGNPSRTGLRTVVALALVAVLAWQAYSWHQKITAGQDELAQGAAARTVQPLAAEQSPLSANKFLCDGRQHCSQMTSCNEVKAFLENCPGMKLDGDNDGKPCEESLCKGRLF